MTSPLRFGIFIALFELLRYDLVRSIFGFRGIERSLREKQFGDTFQTVEFGCVCRAVDDACTLYWRRVRCLQRSVVVARMLRALGANAEVVIGYRPAPFFSHAWVEVAGHAINDSAAYRERLRVLTRI